MLEKLIEKMNSLYQMKEEIADKIRSFTKIVTYKAGDFILKEGQVCNRACLVVKGLTRSFYLNEGVDITSRFMEEGSIVTSWPSYYTQKPGNEFIEAVEDTTLGCLSYSDIQQLYIDFPEFNINGRLQTEYHPTLLQRVPLKHIATYLGMSEETLSRVRTKYHKKHS
jgi:signal-transduction protein with cAMP-binding, CBS, and nucleotidyltransferase domain